MPAYGLFRGDFVQACVQLSLELNRFHNIDLFQRGVYRVSVQLASHAADTTDCVCLHSVEHLPGARAYIASDGDEPLSETGFMRAEAVRDTAFSRAFAVLYRNEQVPLNDVFRFTCHILLDASDPLTALDAVRFQLILGLLFSDKLVSDSTPAVDQQPSAENQSQLELVCSRTLLLHFSPHRGLHYHVPALFDYFHLSAVTLTLHASLVTIDLNVQPALLQLLETQGSSRRKYRPSISLSSALSHSSVTSDGAASANGGADLRSDEVARPVSDKLSVKRFSVQRSLSSTAAECDQSKSSTVERLCRLHMRICVLLLACAESLYTHLSAVGRLLSPHHGGSLQWPAFSINTQHNRRRLQALTAAVTAAAGAGDQEQLTAVITQHVTRLCGETTLLWQQLLQVATCQERVQRVLMRRHHILRVRRHAELFFTADLPRSAATGCFDGVSVEQQRHLTGVLRRSAYLLSLPPLPVECLEMDGEPHSLPIIYEERYQHASLFVVGASGGVSARPAEPADSKCVIDNVPAVNNAACSSSSSFVPIIAVRHNAHSQTAVRSRKWYARSRIHDHRHRGSRADYFKSGSFAAVDEVNGNQHAVFVDSCSLLDINRPFHNGVSIEHDTALAVRSRDLGAMPGNSEADDAVSLCDFRPKKTARGRAMVRFQQSVGRRTTGLESAGLIDDSSMLCVHRRNPTAGFTDVLYDYKSDANVRRSVADSEAIESSSSGNDGKIRHFRAEHDGSFNGVSAVAENNDSINCDRCLFYGGSMPQLEKMSLIDSDDDDSTQMQTYCAVSHDRSQSATVNGRHMKRHGIFSYQSTNTAHKDRIRNSKTSSLSKSASLPDCDDQPLTNGINPNEHTASSFIDCDFAPPLDQEHNWPDSSRNTVEPSVLKMPFETSGSRKRHGRRLRRRRKYHTYSAKSNGWHDSAANNGETSSSDRASEEFLRHMTAQSPYDLHSVCCQRSKHATLADDGGACDCYTALDSGDPALQQRSSSAAGRSTLRFLEARAQFRQHMLSHFQGSIYSDHIEPVTSQPYLSVPDEARVFSQPTNDVHLIVCVHGLDGTAADLRLVRTFLQLALGNSSDSAAACFVMSSANQGDTFSDLDTLVDRLVEEIIEHIHEHKLRPSRLSFIGHSLGCIIIRGALCRPLMAPYLDRLHTFLSLSGPHLGALYNNSTLVNMGLWLMQKFKKSVSLRQLAMRDAAQVRDTFLYRLARSSLLHRFRHVLLTGSSQDKYVPLHSARIELCKSAARDRSAGGAAYREMVELIIGPMVDRADMSLVRYNVHHALSGGTSALIGRAAHVAALDSEIFIEKFLLVAALKYFK